MCNLSLGLWEKAATEARMQGVREGRLEGRLDILINMILDGLTTIDKLRATGRYTSEELDSVAKSLKQ